MGLLDDAIREHLDLKRRRGADPTEVERDERDALGPVRRAPENAPGTDVPQTPGSSFAYDQEEDWDDDQLAETPRSRARRIREEPQPDFEDEAAFEDEPEPAPAPASRPSRLARIFGKPEPEAETDPEAELEPEAEPEYEHEIEPQRPRPVRRREGEEDPPRSARSDDTAPFETAEAPEHSEPADPAEDEDVLEETPEFLQDTPDHDRLWFEQRPPRDFDLDS
jgi:hypothetical protein